MIRARALVCDHPGCDHRILGTNGPRARLARRVRRIASEAGWTRDASGRDLCPDHAVSRTAELERIAERLEGST